MSINLPHEFPSLLEGTTTPVLIVGSGASSPLAPTPEGLFANKCRDAEEKLGCCSGIDFDNPGVSDDLYSWADAVIRELEQRGEPMPKLQMAEKLGILSDLKWRPPVSRRALQNLERHRVIARFVRENRWKAIWSLNWDTYLETAFESIGIYPDTVITLNELPWRSKYITFITEDDYASDDVFKLHKPHGCVLSLIEAKKAIEDGNSDNRAERLSGRFLVRRSEMATVAARSANQDFNFYASIRENFSKHSLYTLGWKASVEEYLLEALGKIGDQLGTNSEDTLCIINSTYHVEEGKHDELARIYGRSEEQAHIKVVKDESTEDILSTDDLFLWLQSKYVLGILPKWAPNAKNEIQVRIDSLNPPDPATQRLIFDWADCFLPAWIRLCWRAGLIEYYHEGKIIRNHDIRMESPDEHVPLCLDGTLRKDIKSAVPLLLALTDGDADLNLRKYPGGIYRANDSTLIVPLPGWKIDYDDLGGLNPLIEELRQKNGFGLVERIAVLPVGFDSAPVVEGAQAILPQKLASKMDALPFAKVDGINFITLEDIAGGGDK